MQLQRFRHSLQKSQETATQDYVRTLLQFLLTPLYLLDHTYFQLATLRSLEKHNGLLLQANLERGQKIPGL